MATMGEYRSWSPRDTTRWSLRIISLRVITKGSTRNWVNSEMNCQSGRDRHRNVSKPREHFIFKTRNEKVHEEPSFVGCCPLTSAPICPHIAVRGRSSSTESWLLTLGQQMVEFRIWFFLLQLQHSSILALVLDLRKANLMLGLRSIFK